MRKQWLGLLLLGLLTACASVEEVDAVIPTPPKPGMTSSPTESPTATQAPTNTAAPSPTPLACWHEGGILVEDQVPSQLLPEATDMLVYLPPCYFALPEVEFPVLYLIHGQSFNQDQWVRLGAADTADALIAGGEAAPFLIVMPYVDDWRQPSEFPFGQALIEEVLPYIETAYRASAQREDRAVGGLSRGGSWSLHLGVHYWDKFSAFGGHSAPVFFDDAELMINWLAAIPPEQAPRITLDIASSELNDIRRSATWFAGQLEAYGIEHHFHEYSGDHTEGYWLKHVESYLRFYTATWKP
ncbi:MAG: alpha/beta hydrolase-fold protein [Chloroflexota bacterium]